MLNCFLSCRCCAPRPTLATQINVETWFPYKSLRNTLKMRRDGTEPGRNAIHREGTAVFGREQNRQMLMEPDEAETEQRVNSRQADLSRVVESAD